MNTLIIYATNSGATEIVSQIVEEVLTGKGMTVTRKDVTQVKPEDLDAFELILLGSPSWDFDGKEGWPHEHFVPFMDALKQKVFEGKKFAVFGLGDSSYNVFCGAVDHLENLILTVKGTRICQSLRIDGFYFNQDENSQKARQWAESVVTSAGQ